MNGRVQSRLIGRRFAAPNTPTPTGRRGAGRWQWDVTDPVIPGHPAGTAGGGLHS